MKTKKIPPVKAGILFKKNADYCTSWLKGLSALSSAVVWLKNSFF
jgi:hypothetical protein